MAQFKDRDNLEAWLQDKPIEWSQVIAARTAFRVMPLLFDAIYHPNNSFSATDGLRLTLLAFRASFLTWAACKYPIQDMSVGRAAVANAANAAHATAHAANAIAPYAAAARAGYVAARAARAAAANAPNANAAHASAANAAARAVSAAHVTALTANAEAVVYAANAADANWLDIHDGEGLLDQPLWLNDVREEFGFKSIFPDWALESLAVFENSTHVQDGPWGLWLDWYRALLPDAVDAKPYSFFGKKRDIALATQPDEFWGDEKSDPTEIVQNIAELVKRKWGGGSPDEPLDPSDKPSAKQIDRVRPHSDAATAEDKLDRRTFARTLVERINEISQPEEQDGFAVHLHAPWGAGKSSVLKLMEEAFSGLKTSENKLGNWVVVDFNAWDNERRNPPWWPMVEALKVACFKCLWKSKGQDGRTYLGTDQLRSICLAKYWCCWKLLADRLPTLAALVAGGFLAYFLFDDSIKNVGETLTEWSKIIGSGVAVIGTAIATFVAVGHTLVFGSKHNANFYADLSKNPLGKVSKLFERIIKISNRPVCIFIDDLDRCDADYVVDLLEGIQTSFRFNNVVYVVAADRSWIRSSFESRYKTFTNTVGDEGQPLGYLFLEKIFQLSTPLPGMSKQIREEYWRDLCLPDSSDSVTVSNINADDAQSIGEFVSDKQIAKIREAYEKQYPQGMTFSEAQQNIKEDSSPANKSAVIEALNTSRAAETEAAHALEPFAKILPHNPRVMKRILNAYAMRLTIVLSEGIGGDDSENTADDNSVDTDQLMRWTILEQRYPALVDVLIENSQLVDQLNDTTLEKRDANFAIRPFVGDDAVRQIIASEAKVVLTAARIQTLVRGQQN